MSVENFRRLLNYFQNRDLRRCPAGLVEYADEIIRRGSDVGCNITFLNKVDRLMPIARKEAMDLDRLGLDMPSGKTWIASSLSHARGRGVRTWWAPTGGIYICLALAPVLMRRHWGLYSLSLGVSVAEVLRDWGFDARIRWINDVMLADRKVVGILAESFRVPNASTDYILFGIGVNVNMLSFPKEISHIATSLAIERGKSIPENRLCAHIIARIRWNFGLLHFWESRLLSSYHPPENPIVSNFKTLTDSIGKRVVFGSDAELEPELEAWVKDVDESGNLLLLLDDGQSLLVNAGEVRYV